MNVITRLIVIMFLLFLIMTSTIYSQSPVKLNGSEGTALLQSLTKNPLNLNNSSANLSMPRNASADFDS